MFNNHGTESLSAEWQSYKYVYK